MSRNIIITESQYEYIVRGLKNMPLLTEVYGGTKNTSYPISLNETNAKRLLNRHTANGYAIISACRGRDDFNLGDTPQDRQKLANINAERTRQLIADVQKVCFSYTLAYGGFIENKGEANEEHVYERSVIVYAEKRDGKAYPQELYKFAVAECEKFNQDSVLIKMPNDKPKYVKSNGDIDFTFEGEPTFDDISQTYFTDLHKNTQGKIKNGSRPTRFIFTESFIAPKPQCYSESHIRYLKGEVFLLK